MNVTAKFLADFTSFEKAVGTATLKLRSFESDAGSVERQLNRIGDSFSGRRILQEATLAAKAVQDIGGVSKLTEKEQARLNATVTEAIAKYKALGQAAPKELLEMEAATRGVGKEMQTASTMAGTWKTQLSSLAGAFGVAFSVGAAVNFGRELLRMGDEIVKVGDRTGLTIKEVQQLGYVAGQSGNSIEEITGAIGQMQNRLVSGDASAVAAVKFLGVNLKALTDASPAAQMGMIADAMAKVQDPAQRAALAMDIFGKAGIGILPTLTSNFSDLAAAAPVMSDATVKALDSAGDAIARLGLQIKVWAAESYNLARQGFEALIAGAYQVVASFLDMTARVVESLSRFEWASKAMQAFGVDLGAVKTEAQWFSDAAAAMATTTNTTTEAVKKLSPAMYAGAEGVKAAAKEMKAAETEAAKLRQTMNWVGEEQMKADAAMLAFAPSVEKASEKVRALVSQLHLAPPGIDAMRNASQGLTTDGLIPTRAAAEALRIEWAMHAKVMTNWLHDGDETVTMLDRIKNVATDAIGGLNDIFQRAFEGGGGIAGAVKSFATNVTKNLLDMIPGVGPILSQFSGAIVAGFQKLGSAIFGGPSAAEKAGREAAAKFRQGLEAGLSSAQKAEAAASGNAAWAASVIAIRDAYLATGRSEAEALAMADRLWKAEKEGAESVAGVIAEINGVFDQQKADVELLNEAIQAYGFSIEELGPAMQRQQLGEQALTLAEHWRVLVQSGIDVATINERMSGAMADYLTLAIKTGQEVPAEMEGILQSMVDQGVLLDANGNKIEKLEDLGVTFAETLTEGFDRVVEALQLVARGLGMEIPASTARASRSMQELGGSTAAAIGTGITAVQSLDGAIVAMGTDFQTVQGILGAGVQIPVDFQFGASGWAGMGGGGSGGNGGSSGGGYLTPDEASEAGADWRPKSEFGWSDSAYRDVRTEDQTELNQQAEAAGLSFARGTGGKYLDFGAGSLAMLHGRERVVTEAEGEAETASLASVASELAAIRQLLRDQPRQLGVALQTALVYGGAR